MKSTELLQRVIDSGVLAFEQDAPEKLESLEADICEFLKPAAHLTIPGALEWDGDNGTHGADGESCVAVRDAITETLGDAYDCTRVWSAWQVGTMDQNDFSLIVEDDSRLDELAEAAIQAYDNSEVTCLRAQLANTEQSRRSFFDLSQDLEKRLASLKAFASEMIGAAFEGGSFDGGDIQDIAVKHGLLQIEQRTEECGEVCACREYGFPAECYRKTDLLKPADEPVIAQAALDDIPDFTPGNGNKAKRRIAAMEAAKLESFPCWSCSAPVTMEQRAAADGDCPHCAAELDLEDWPIAKGAGGCAYEAGDWQCREGGYLWYAGDGEGWDPEDCTHICPHCRTKDYLESAKEDAESCSSYSNPGSSGTGLDIWTAAEKTALTANHPAACKALAEIGPVSALDADDVVICNTQQAGWDQVAKGGDDE